MPRSRLSIKQIRAESLGSMNLLTLQSAVAAICNVLEKDVRFWGNCWLTGLGLPVETRQSKCASCTSTLHTARGHPRVLALNLRSNKAFRSGQKTFQMTNFVNRIAKN